MRRLLFIVALIGGCEGIPQPDPIPIATLIRTTGAMPTITSVDVVGLPGAVAGVGRVTVSSPHQTITVDASASGSFALIVDAAENDLLQVRFESSEAAVVTVPLLPIMTAPQPDPLHVGSPITAPVSGVSTIFGQGIVQASILAVNFRTAATNTTVADAAGRFSLTIPAEAGDEVRVYIESDPLSSAWVLTVP